MAEKRYYRHTTDLELGAAKASPIAPQPRRMKESTKEPLVKIRVDGSTPKPGYTEKDNYIMGTIKGGTMYEKDDLPYNKKSKQAKKY